MADTKISALSSVASVVGAQEFAVNDAGVSKKASGTQMSTFFWNAPVFAAGSSSASSKPKLTSGTVMSTPEAGAVEYDSGGQLYFTPDATNFKRGMISVYSLIRLHAAYTLGSNTNVQKLFNQPTNGQVNLPLGSYIFEAVIALDTMSATSGNAALQLTVGSAVITNVLQVVVGIDAVQATAGAAAGASWSVTVDAPAANTSVVTAQTTAGLAFYWKGSFEVTTAGTLTPSIDLITANAAVVKIGSYMTFMRVGDATTTTIGNWA